MGHRCDPVQSLGHPLGEFAVEPGRNDIGNRSAMNEAPPLMQFGAAHLIVIFLTLAPAVRACGSIVAERIAALDRAVRWSLARCCSSKLSRLSFFAGDIGCRLGADAADAVVRLGDGCDHRRAVAHGNRRAGSRSLIFGESAEVAGDFDAESALWVSGSSASSASLSRSRRSWSASFS